MPECRGAKSRHFCNGTASMFTKVMQWATCSTEPTCLSWKTTWAMLWRTFSILLGPSIFPLPIAHRMYSEWHALSPWVKISQGLRIQVTASYLALAVTQHHRLWQGWRVCAVPPGEQNQDMGHEHLSHQAVLRLCPKRRGHQLRTHREQAGKGRRSCRSLTSTDTVI